MTTTAPNAWDCDDEWTALTLERATLRGDGWWELWYSNGLVGGYDGSLWPDFEPRKGDYARVYMRPKHRPHGLMIRDTMIIYHADKTPS